MRQGVRSSVDLALVVAADLGGLGILPGEAPVAPGALLGAAVVHAIGVRVDLLAFLTERAGARLHQRGHAQRPPGGVDAVEVIDADVAVVEYLAEARGLTSVVEASLLARIAVGVREAVRGLGVAVPPAVLAPGAALRVAHDADTGADWGVLVLGVEDGARSGAGHLHVPELLDTSARAAVRVAGAEVLLGDDGVELARSDLRVPDAGVVREVEAFAPPDRALGLAAAPGVGDLRELLEVRAVRVAGARGTGHLSVVEGALATGEGGGSGEGQGEERNGKRSSDHVMPSGACWRFMRGLGTPCVL